MKHIIRFCILALIIGTAINAQAGMVLYEKSDLQIGFTNVSAWVGEDIRNNETVGGLKTSLVKYSGFGLDKLNMALNLDAGLIGTQIEKVSDIDAIVGISITLPEPKEWKGKVYFDVGVAYSPDFIVGPERVILYGGLKAKF